MISQTNRSRWLGASLLIMLGAASATAGEVVSVPLWGRWEASWTARGEAPADQTRLAVELVAPSGRVSRVEGFWDGGTLWKARFRPDETGEWKFRARCEPSRPGLDGQVGTFLCEKSTRRGQSDRFLLHGPVQVAREVSSHLEHADGTPFFWLGDTVWNGPALSTDDDWNSFLDDRVAKHFSVIQFNVLCPWRAAAADAEGQTAFDRLNDGKIRVNPRFFQRLDRKYDALRQRGLLAAPVLVWAHRKGDPGVDLNEDAILTLVRYQLARHGAENVVWILAGDSGYNPEQAARWKRIGRAVFGESGGGTHAPVCTHPTGMNWPWESWAQERWLSVLGYQSGHGDDDRTLEWIHSGPAARRWAGPPLKPVINLEPPYEDHRAYQSRQPHSAYNVRRAVYWSLLSTPMAGVTYGAHGIWSWETQPGREPRDHAGTGIAKVWSKAKDLPGSVQMGYLAQLVESLPWWDFAPAQGLLTAQPGEAKPSQYITATRTRDKSQALVYLPRGGSVELKSEELAGGATQQARWFDPRAGRSQPATSEGGTAKSTRFRAPDDQDWLLVLGKS